MESAGAASDSNWSSFSSSMPTEDPEIMALLFGSTPFPDEPHREEQSLEMPTYMYWNDHETVPPYYSSNDANASFSYWPQSCASNYGTSYLVPPENDIEGYYLSDPASASQATGGGPAPMGFFTVEEKTNSSPLPNAPEDLLEEYSCFETGSGASVSPPRRTPPTPKRGLPVPDSDKSNKNITTVSSKKKSRVTDVNGKSVQSKRAQKNPKNSEPGECNNTASLTRQNSGSFSSEDDLSSVQDVNDGEENSGTKGSKLTRAGRGSATDPQSLYARKRREKINERLKILQNLVPNGTKVDISTMLEEAVQYVKFLQLQIKLLSSDDLWMYAPLAYNGMDIGLDLNISPPQ